MKDSNGIIADLIKTTGAFKSKKKTWCTSTVTWLRKNKIPLDMNIKETTRRVKAAVTVRKTRKDKSVIGATASKYGIGSGKELHIAELTPETSTLGIATLFRLRTGTYRTTNEMIATGKLSPIYKDRCILCNLEVKETAEHLILDCNALADERRLHLSSIINEINLWPADPVKRRKWTLKILLGGEMPAFGRKPAEIIPCLSKYLSALVVKRAAKLAVIKTTSL